MRRRLQEDEITEASRQVWFDVAESIQDAIDENLAHGEEGIAKRMKKFLIQAGRADAGGIQKSNGWNPNQRICLV